MIYTAAASPFVDAFTTWGAIAASYLVAKKILENWFYWFVIDFVSVFLFVSRELYPTALLFIVYLVLVVIGYSAWRKSWQLQMSRIKITETISDTPYSQVAYCYLNDVKAVLKTKKKQLLPIPFGQS